MNLSKAFGFCQNESVAIIGSHGKTSLCLALSKENSKKKIAHTTTTKIFPVIYEDLNIKNFYDFYGKNLPNSLQNGVNVFGKFDKNNKISSLKKTDLEHLRNISDMLIYEADGSKTKPFKAWNEYEPVILEKTSIIIGIIPINFIGQQVDENLIHRFELFCKKFSVSKNDKIDKYLILKIANEMFKKTPKNAKKILFLNRYEDTFQNSAEFIAQNLEQISTFAGSIKNKTIKKIK